MNSNPMEALVKIAIRIIGTVFIVIALIAYLFFAKFFQTLVTVNITVLPIIAGVAVLALLFSISKKARYACGLTVYCCGWLIGAAAIGFGFANAHMFFGWIGAIIGFILAGIGIVPVGIIGAFINGFTANAVGLIVLAIVALAFIFSGNWCITSAEKEWEKTLLHCPECGGTGFKESYIISMPHRCVSCGALFDDDTLGIKRPSGGQDSENI